MNITAELIEYDSSFRQYELFDGDTYLGELYRYLDTGRVEFENSLDGKISETTYSIDGFKTWLSMCLGSDVTEFRKRQIKASFE